MDTRLRKPGLISAPLALGAKAPTVFLVDGDAASVAATTRLLRAGGYSVSAFTSASEFLASLPPNVPGCVILDLRMAEFSGLEVQKMLARSANPLPVIFLTGQGDIPASVQAMRSGAEDFLTKRTRKEYLLDAVERAVARDSRERTERQRRQALRARFESLTPREREVLDYVLKGRMNKEIASALNLNERTVKLHRTSITSKLQVQSIAELISAAHRAGILDPGRLGEEKRQV